MVGVREGTPLGARREILLQPLHLGGGGPVGDDGVERNDVPVTEIVAVVPLRGIPRRRAEITEVTGGPRRHVIVVSGDRVDPRLMPAPRGSEAVREVGGGSIGVHVVADRDYAAGDVVEQRGGGFVPGRGARRDVPGTHDDDDATANRRGGSRGSARRSERIRDRERDGIYAVRRVAVHRPDPGAGRAVA